MSWSAADTIDWLLATIGFAIMIGFWFTRTTAEGILLWYRMTSRVRTITLNAGISVVFEPDELPLTNDVVSRVKAWNGDVRFELISKLSERDGSLKRLDLHPSRVGRIVFEIIETPEGFGDSDEAPSVRLLLPPSPRGLNQLVRVVEQDLEDLVSQLSPLLGEPVGMRLDAQIESGVNPFYGVYLRDDIARVGVTSLDLRLQPQGAAMHDLVDVATDSIHIESQARPSFVRLVRSYLGFMPAGA